MTNDYDVEPVETLIEPAQSSNDSGYTISSSRMFGRRRRLDGYHYNPSSECVLAALKKSGRTLDSLGSVCERVFGVKRFKHFYGNEGIPYLDSEDIFKLNPEILKLIPEVSKKDAEAYFVQKGWVLMACSGQIYGLNGGVVLADTWHENKSVSNHVVRIEPRKNAIRSGFLQMAMAHPLYGRPLILRLAFGTEVPEIDPLELVDFPLPRIDTKQENAIADRIEEASSLRMTADKTENDAVGFVEAYLEPSLGITSTATKIA